LDGLFDAAFERDGLSSSLQFPEIGGKVPAKARPAVAEQSDGLQRLIRRVPSDGMDTIGIVVTLQ
jgi:hypothetical protein